MDKRKMLKISLPNGNYIVAEINNPAPHFPQEMCVYIADKDGCAVQDLVMVRAEYTTDKGRVNISDDINVLVWADENDEDYTDDFVIPQYKDGE